MSQVSHDFTKEILKILTSYYGKIARDIYNSSDILKYLNIKTKAANRGSKTRASYANLYAIYVLVEDYIQGEFHQNRQYNSYEGAKFSSLLNRQRQLPFGSKLQNHALNHRLNEEFKKYFPTSEDLPIIRDVESNKYWINENLLLVNIVGEVCNISYPIKEIIEMYIEVRKKSFNEFMECCQQLIGMEKKDYGQSIRFIKELLKPNVDARIFEIVSYAILKSYYSDKSIYWGWSPSDLTNEHLALYKTGRTNANDGGIDFVMKPLGRFFQVTETVSVDKYFLDIDKVQHYPFTFIVKSNETQEQIIKNIRNLAESKYPIKTIVKKYMDCIEEVINLPDLVMRYDEVLKKNKGDEVIKEIILQSKIEFNFIEDILTDEEPKLSESMNSGITLPSS